MKLKLLGLVAVAVWLSCDGHSVCRAQSDGVSKGPDWPRFLGPGIDGVAPPSDARIDWSKPPEFLWAIDVGDGYGIGSVSGNRFYQCDAEGARGSFRSQDARERLRCFNLDTGELIWSQSEPLNYRDIYQYEAGPRSSPTIVDDRVLTFGVGGRLVCRKTSDGTKLWEVDTSSDYGVVQNFFGVGSSPLVLGDRVIVMVGGKSRRRSANSARAVGQGDFERDRRWLPLI